MTNAVTSASGSNNPAQSLGARRLCSNAAFSPGLKTKIRRIASAPTRSISQVFGDSIFEYRYYISDRAGGRSPEIDRQ